MSQTRLMNEGTPVAKKDKIDLYFEKISFSVEVEVKQEGCVLPCKKKYESRTILDGISGVAKGSEVTAIMGASGAGKTTLLNIIGCRVAHVEADAPLGTAQGKLFANSELYTFSKFNDFANYIMQQDILLATLTVQETLEYVAALKMDKPEAERKWAVMRLMKELKLESCKDTLVGDNIIKGISGGEKKRTSVAFEIISDPRVIVLDEPTSGLDSLTAFIICNYLKKLAHNHNKTVLMTIHQPNSDIFRLFDRLILMVEGRCIYQGHPLMAIEYFGKMGLACPEFSNPPDYFMSIMHHESAQNVANYPKYFATYEKEQAPMILKEFAGKNKQEIETTKNTVGFCQRLGAIMKKNVINIIRNPLILKSKLIQAIILGLFVGGVYFAINQNDDYIENQNGAIFASVDFYTLAGLLFFLGIGGMMSTLSPVSIVFPRERIIFLKEEGAGLYNTITFFLSYFLVELPLLVITPLIYSAIIYWMIGLANTAGQFFTFYFILVLISFAGNSMGMLIGSAISDAQLVPIVVPVFIMPFILFSGFFKNREDLPVWISWIEYISPIKYAFIALIRNQIAGEEDEQTLLSFLSFEENITLWNSIFILLGLGVGYALLALLFLYIGRKKLQ